MKMSEKEESRRFKVNLALLLFFYFLSIATTVGAQEYTFNFYNGDVETDGEKVKVDSTEKKFQLEERTKPVNTNKVDEDFDSERTKRTGISFIGGYTQRNLNGFDHGYGPTDLDAKTQRFGLALISDYDTSLEIEFLKSDVSGKGFRWEPIRGETKGASIGLKHDYWFVENIALSLGGSIHGSKGTLKSNFVNYDYDTMGASLSAGPTMDFGKVRLHLAYEYSVDRVSMDEALDSTKGSGFKGMLSYRF